MADKTQKMVDAAWKKATDLEGRADRGTLMLPSSRAVLATSSQIHLVMRSSLASA